MIHKIISNGKCIWVCKYYDQAIEKAATLAGENPGKAYTIIREDIDGNEKEIDTYIFRR